MRGRSGGGYPEVNLAPRRGREALLQSRGPCTCLPPQEACHRAVSGGIPGKAPRASGLRPQQRPPLLPVASSPGPRPQLLAPRSRAAAGLAPRGKGPRQDPLRDSSGSSRGGGGPDTWPMSGALSRRVGQHLCLGLALPGRRQVYGLAGPSPSAGCARQARGPGGCRPKSPRFARDASPCCVLTRDLKDCRNTLPPPYSGALSYGDMGQLQRQEPLRDG